MDQIFVLAFRYANGQGLSPVSPATALLNEIEAINAAKLFAARYAGAVAWKRTLDTATGIYEKPIILFEAGSTLKVT